ncbi:MAG: DUF4258 domain-containing protein [Alphaproteobacteria bacterium]|jgi:hypothetical protein
MECHTLIFSGHALQRMFARSIAPAEIRAVLESAEIIETYPDDVPYPSSLLLGFTNSQPIHVVIGYDKIIHECYVVTAYRPDPALWDSSFKVRRTV